MRKFGLPVLLKIPGHSHIEVHLRLKIIKKKTNNLF